MMLHLSLVIVAMAQNIAPEPVVKEPTTYSELMAARVPVTSNDITDRPYRLIAHVKRNVRKSTIFSENPSREKLENELWERGRKVQADAVLNARYIDDGTWARAQGASAVKGDAVKFLTDAEIATLRQR